MPSAREASTLAQRTYSDNRGQGATMCGFSTINFGKGDFSWTGTYDDDHHPEPGDTIKADRDHNQY